MIEAGAMACAYERAETTGRDPKPLGQDCRSIVNYVIE
jgi:hypothetical protein